MGGEHMPPDPPGRAGRALHAIESSWPDHSVGGCYRPVLSVIAMLLFSSLTPTAIDNPNVSATMQQPSSVQL